MDVCTSLVQAYLRVNGYFTATEYPVVEFARGISPRTLTDIDMLAVRFGRKETGGAIRRQEKSAVSGPLLAQTDPKLDCTDERTDMIVAEVKQGRAQVNPASRNRHVLAAALARFGCCRAAESSGLVRDLLQHGRAQGIDGHAVRMVLFASRGERAPAGWHWVHLDHVFRYLDSFLRSEQATLGNVDLRDPAVAWLSLLHKCELQIAVGKPAT